MADVSITFLFVFCWSISTINGQICGRANESEIIKDCGRNITESYVAFIDFHTGNLQPNCSCRLTPAKNGRIYIKLPSIPNPQNCFTSIKIQRHTVSWESLLRFLNCTVTSIILQTKGEGDVFSIGLSNTNETIKGNQFFYCVNISSEDHQNTFTLSCQSRLDDQEENKLPPDSEISLVLIGIVCGVLGIIIASGLGCFLLALHKRNSNKNAEISASKNVGHEKLEKTDDENVNEDDDEDDGLKENPLYQSADDSQHYTYMDMPIPVNSGHFNNDCNI